MNNEEINEKKHQIRNLFLQNRQIDSSSPICLSFGSQVAKDDPDDQPFLVHSPQNFVPKFLEGLENKSSTSSHTPGEGGLLSSMISRFPLPIQISTNPTISLQDDNNIERLRAGSFKDNPVQQPHKQLIASASYSNYRSKLGSIATDRSQLEQKEENENNFEDRSNVKKDSGVIMDNFAAALVARVKVKGAFSHAAENRVFDASNQELTVINDKAYVIDYREIDKKQRYIRSRRKKGGRLRLILQKHGIVSENLIKKKKAASKLNKSRSTVQNLKRQLTHFREGAKNFGSRLVESYYSVKERISDAISGSYIHPHGRFRLIWDFISMVFIFYDLVNVPYVISFDVDSTLGTFIFDTFKDVFFMIDVLINFKTGYFEDANLITDPFLISKKYLRKWFTIDLLTSLPISLIVDLSFDEESGDLSAKARAFRLLRFLRFARLARVFKAIKLKKLFVKMEEFFYSSVFNGIKGLFGLFFSIILLAHWVACIWHFVGSLGYDETGDSWLTHYGIAEASQSDRYIASLYWAIATMLTVGYGDILPVSTPERIFNIFVMLLGCATFGYSMNSIGILVQNIQAGVSRTRQIYYDLSKYMNQKKVSKNIRSKVVHYLDYMIETQKHGKLAEEQLFSILSENIRAELKKDVNGQVLRENALFQKSFGNKFLNILSNSLEEKVYSPGEVIFDEMDKTCHMYFISTGTVEIYYSDCNVIIKKLERECHFGEIAFFTGKSRTAAARSNTFSDIFYIQRDAFLSLVEDYTADKEMFHLIKDSINLYNSFDALELKCLLCNHEGHVAKDCHRVHYVPDKDKIIAKHHADEASFNKSFKRERVRNQFHALGNWREVQRRAGDYCTDNPNEIQKILQDSFGAAFFNIVNQVKTKTDGKPFKKMLGKSKTDLGLQTVVSDNTDDQPDTPEKKVKFAEEISGELSGKRKGASKEEIEAERGSKGSLKSLSRRRNFNALLRVRQRLRNKESKGETTERRKTQESVEEDTVVESEGKTSITGMSTPTRNNIKQKHFTVVQMGKGAEQKNLLVELKGINFDLNSHNLLGLGNLGNNITMPVEDTPLEMVANFSIYFPHNNISKILTDIRLQQNYRNLRKDSMNSDTSRFEMRFKKAKGNESDSPREKKALLAGKSRKSIFMWSRAGSQDSKHDGESMLGLGKASLLG